MWKRMHDINGSYGVIHKANEHHEEVEIFNVEIHSTAKEDKEKKKSRFFSKSMLDDFL